jgi:hypothetical protein
MNHKAIILALLTLVAAPVGRAAAEPVPATDKDVAALAALIDQRIAAHWASRDVQPAPRADDAEFYRRVSLDLAGRIPGVTDIRDFLDDDRPNKRRLWVEDLLRRDSYSDHFTNVWRAWLLAQSNQQVFFQQGSFEAWLRRRLHNNLPYDQFVRELLTAQAPANFAQPGNESPAAFYQANENKAENLAGTTARLFLDVKLECAQCHNHPFDKWTKTQFWEFAAFFAGVTPQAGRLNGQPAPATDRREIKIPGTDKVVKARYLDGSEPKWADGTSTRATLVAWLTAADNPYFARATVNRMWTYFFGVGLSNQFDTGEKDEPVHAELLDEMARQFAAHGFDLKFLIRAIVASETYQRASAVSHPSQQDPRLFARMSLRGLSPEQLFDSLATATEYTDGGYGGGQPFLGAGNQTPRGKFLARFAAQDKPVEHQTSILQALYLMNNEFIADRTSLEHNKSLAVIAQQATSTSRKIESLYLLVLSRKPRAAELERLVKYVDEGGPTHDSKKALTDIFWVLLNSSEFILNH